MHNSLKNFTEFAPPLSTNLSTLQRRLERKVVKTASCWIWTGKRTAKGYGVITAGNLRIMASRASWILRYGPVPTNLLVMHKCDNPPCVNPDHLMLGTYRDNAMDAWRKGRANFQKADWTASAEKNGNAKLGWGDVESIRLKFASGHKATAIGREFGVSYQTIYDIAYNKSWKPIRSTSTEPNCPTSQKQHRTLPHD